MKMRGNSISVLIISCLCLFATAVYGSQTMSIHELAIVSASPPVSSTATLPDMPMGQSADGQDLLLPEENIPADDSDLFGMRGGYVHPYITFGGEYTDNLYNVKDDIISSYIGRIAPGIWFSLPRTKQIPITIVPHNSSPGGLQLQLQDYEGTDRYQAYALGGLDFISYSENSALNDTDGKLEGVFRYNMRGGLSLQVLDRLTYGQDRFEIGSLVRDNLRRYTSNLAMGTADYLMTEKVRIRFDYSNFMLNYDDQINDPFDRDDNTFDLYGYYIYSLKTSFFLEYRFTDVTYDYEAAKDNTQNYLYGGITWDTTEKLALLFKAGYQSRNYERDLVAENYDWGGLTFDLQALYRWTEKTQFKLDMYRTSEESDSSLAVDKVVLGAAFGYQQNYTEKLTGVIDFIYENADYSQIIDNTRDDTSYYFRPALRYLFREWLMAELAYVYNKRDSTDDIFDYTTNSVIININLSM